ncbi:hypothetical protein [Paraburkholderia saeva]|uniref:Uncharacterized protein n=1 Tax=Paraburkholderia saeva TaxID=2777537 RepID=A0A9N8RY13_9BURK|nr:hypothetical protein [Paraburkholderia saeva]CAG4901021.1 hypothetical protein LMG31841_02944 [Paraburkholderia saeva]
MSTTLTRIPATGGALAPVSPNPPASVQPSLSKSLAEAVRAVTTAGHGRHVRLDVSVEPNGAARLILESHVQGDGSC